MSITTPPRNAKLTTLLKPGLGLPENKYQSGDCALIIGAGLAGCATAYVLAQKGFHCKIYESNQIAAGATSGLPVAVFRPYISIGNDVVNDYFANAFERILTELKHSDPTVYQQRGLLQLIKNTDKWQPGKHWSVETSDSASEIAHHPVSNGALYIKQAGVITPSGLCAQWIQSSSRIELNTNSPVAKINKTPEGWQLKDNTNKSIGEGQLIVLANGNGVNHLVGQNQFPLTPIKGQISHFKTQRKPAGTAPLLTAKGYAIPSRSGYWAGATHQRNSENRSITVTDDQSNLDTLNVLAPGVNPAHTADKSWAGIRCTTPDRLPLIGGVPDSAFYRSAYRDLHHGRKNQQYPPGTSLPGLYVVAGLGSRGATQSLYAAECLAGIITGKPTHDLSISTAIHPARFLIRELRKRPAKKL